MLAALAVFALAARLPAEMPLEECRRKAAAGDAEAMWQLGRRHENGDGVRQDRLRALVQYRKAADLKHVRACERLAELYASGDGVVKDPAKAARYRAMARGEDAEAAAKAAAGRAGGNKDPIEQAIDMIEGRVGPGEDLLPSSFDVPGGMRKLYAVGQKDPAARVVFVDLWERGLMDSGLSEWDKRKEHRMGDELFANPQAGEETALTAEEWDGVLPWFREQYRAGRLKCGLVLGNEAFKNGRYTQAVDYWISAGDAGVSKACWRLGLFFDPYPENKELSGPKSMRSDYKAKTAFDQCMRFNSRYATDLVKSWVGLFCLYGSKKCIDYSRAMKIFSGLMKKFPDNKWYPCHYGLAGFRHEEADFAKRWTDKCAKLAEKRAKGQLTLRDQATIEKHSSELKASKAKKAKYLEYVRKAAEMGNEAAGKVYQKMQEECLD